jgi:hypothetical protein
MPTTPQTKWVGVILLYLDPNHKFFGINYGAQLFLNQHFSIFYKFYAFTMCAKVQVHSKVNDDSRMRLEFTHNVINPTVVVIDAPRGQLQNLHLSEAIGGINTICPQVD